MQFLHLIEVCFLSVFSFMAYGQGLMGLIIDVENRLLSYRKTGATSNAGNILLPLPVLIGSS